MCCSLSSGTRRAAATTTNHAAQVVLPLPADWEVEHQVWLEDLQEKQAKPYPQDFINPKRAGGGGAGSAGAVCS